jgi:hypothetical protein
VSRPASGSEFRPRVVNAFGRNVFSRETGEEGAPLRSNGADEGPSKTPLTYPITS